MDITQKQDLCNTNLAGCSYYVFYKNLKGQGYIYGVK